MFASKRANVLDLIIMSIGAFAFASAIIFGHTMWNQIVASGALNTTSQSTQIVVNTNEQFGIFDNLFLFFFVGLGLTSVIAAARVRTSPLFFFLSLVLYTITLIVGYVVQSAYGQLGSTNAILSSSISVFPKMAFIMNHLVVFLVVWGTLITIALYSTRGQESFV